jgi:hypothetical protein
MDFNRTDLAVDIVLAALITSADREVTSLITRAECGDIEIHLKDSTLFYALYSVREGDGVNLPQFARLLRCAFIEATRLPGDRGHEIPSPGMIANWRKSALGDDPISTIITSPPSGQARKI